MSVETVSVIEIIDRLRPLAFDKEATEKELESMVEEGLVLRYELRDGEVIVYPPAKVEQIKIDLSL